MSKAGLACLTGKSFTTRFAINRARTATATDPRAHGASLLVSPPIPLGGGVATTVITGVQVKDGKGDGGKVDTGEGEGDGVNVGIDVGIGV